MWFAKIEFNTWRTSLSIWLIKFPEVSPNKKLKIGLQLIPNNFFQWSHSSFGDNSPNKMLNAATPHVLAKK